MLVDELRRMFEKYIGKIHEFKKSNGCKELVPIAELNGIISLCKLFDCLATPANGVRSLVNTKITYNIQPTCMYKYNCV